jgi:hypothetical protein
MNRWHVYLLQILLLLAVCSYGSSCNRKAGCPATESTKTKLGKNGMPKKKASTQLFSKKTRRKMKKGG